MTPGGLLWRLAPGQVVSWGTLYYGITFLAQPIQATTGWGLSRIFGAYSVGLLVAALCAPGAGRLLTERGGRFGMSLGSALAAASLFAMAWAPGPASFTLAWGVAGAAMSLTLYEAAFTVLKTATGEAFRRVMTSLTLVGGFASTVFWPLSFALSSRVGWRATLVGFATLHLLLCLPLHLSLPGGPGAERQSLRDSTSGRSGLFRLPAYWGLAGTIVLTTLVSGAVSAHADLLLTSRGLEASTILAAVALFGPMQVLSRLLDFSLRHRLSVRVLGFTGLWLMPAAFVFLLLPTQGRASAFLFAALFGAGNGILTLVKGLAPAEVLGATAYGTALGWVSTPGLIARCAAPSMAALLLQHAGPTWTLFGLVGLGFLALAAFHLAYSERSPVTTREP